MNQKPKKQNPNPSTLKQSPAKSSNNNVNLPTNRKDIWTLIKERKEYDKRKNSDEKETSLNNIPNESFVFFVGAKSSGKSTLVSRFLDKSEQCTPTVALEYTFCRKTRNNNSNTKDISHIWELAGGTHLSSLINTPVTESNIHAWTFALVLDLSEPAELIPIITHFITKLNEKTKSLLDGLEQRGSKRPKAMRAFTWKKYGGDHSDKELINPCVTPMIFICNKYDVFNTEQKPETRKLVCKTLRFFAHMYGASLIFTSNKDENSILRFRQLLNSYTFKTNGPTGNCLDYNKPLFVQAGTDSLTEIGSNTGESKTAMTIMKIKSDFEKYYPQKAKEKKRDVIDLSKYPEPSIDALRLQKNEEFERMQKSNDRKANQGVPSFNVEMKKVSA